MKKEPLAPFLLPLRCVSSFEPDDGGRPKRLTSATPCFTLNLHSSNITRIFFMKHLQVAVGIIRNVDKQIFLAQRAATSYMANKWEFPGGKIEAGESAEQGLIRELQEETGIEVTEARPIGQADHSYEDLRVTLHFFLVEGWKGDPWGKEGQPQRWVDQQALVAEEFPPANHPLIARLVAGEF